MISIYVKCPYYRREEHGEQKKIVCEGIWEETSTHHMFPSLEKLNKRKHRFCIDNYNQCPLAQTLNKKYDYKI